jgi:cell division septal protein FtsQ
VRAVVLTAAIVGAIVVSRTSLFNARSVEVSGASSLSRTQVLELAGVDRRTNVIWLDEGAAEHRLESSPWVGDAEVSVSLGLEIRISVSERTPMAVASDGHRSVLVAGDGTTLGPVTALATARALPLIELPSVRFDGAASIATPRGGALALQAMDAGLRATVERVRILADGTLEVWMRGGPRVSFGAATEVERKARAIGRALAWARAAGEEIVTLSVVAPTAPAATLAP